MSASIPTASPSAADSRVPRDGLSLVRGDTTAPLLELTIPAFLADLFGTANVGAIHGALLTAWSVAAVVGPVIITELSDRARAALGPGASKVHIYDQPLTLLAGLLALGFVLTLLVKPVSAPPGGTLPSR